MKRYLFLLVILFICSCRSLPAIQPIGNSLHQFNTQLCSDLYPKGKWQYIHSIEATMPNKKKAFVIGITNISSKDRTINVLMMTIEGLVLFDAKYVKELRIKKAIPPFDSTEFAAGLIEDVKLIFFKPDGMTVQSGYLKDGSNVCRYRDAEDYIIDLYLDQKTEWEIKKYNKHNKLIRHVKSVPITEKQGTNRTSIPPRIELIGFGKHTYSLQMDLLQEKELNK